MPRSERPGSSRVFLSPLSGRQLRGGPLSLVSPKQTSHRPSGFQRAPFSARISFRFPARPCPCVFLSSLFWRRRPAAQPALCSPISFPRGTAGPRAGNLVRLRRTRAERASICAGCAPLARFQWSLGRCLPHSIPTRSPPRAWRLGIPGQEGHSQLYIWQHHPCMRCFLGPVDTGQTCSSASLLPWHADAVRQGFLMVRFAWPEHDPARQPASAAIQPQPRLAVLVAVAAGEQGSEEVLQFNLLLSPSHQGPAVAPPAPAASPAASSLQDDC